MGFWSVHGVLGGLFFLTLLTFMPRLTLVFISVLLGSIGITFWGVIGCVLLPRVLVAILATTVYWDTNPVLCVISWIVALVGEFVEKALALHEFLS